MANGSTRIAVGMALSGLVIGITGGPVADLMSNQRPTYKTPLIGTAVGLAFGLAFGSLLDIDDRLYKLEARK